LSRSASYFSGFCLLLWTLLGGSGIEAADQVLVTMKTDAGDMLIELYPDTAPVTVQNFLNYVDGGYYNGAQFYRVVRADNQQQNKIKIEVIQGGLQAEPEDLPFAAIEHESTELSGIRHTDGVISMARDEPGTASSEFFIVINDQPELDFGGQRNPDGQGFAAFGKVVDGMDVVRTIQSMPTDIPQGDRLEYTSGQILVTPVIIHSLERVQEK